MKWSGIASGRVAGIASGRVAGIASGRVAGIASSGGGGIFKIKNYINKKILVNIITRI